MREARNDCAIESGPLDSSPCDGLVDECAAWDFERLEGLADPQIDSKEFFESEREGLCGGEGGSEEKGSEE